MLIPRPQTRQSGFSLIEIMIALLLSLIAILVIGQVFSLSEARKRITTGSADAQQSATINLFEISRLTRMGGSGLTQGETIETKVWGCRLQAALNGTALVPPASGQYPSPFENLPAATRVFPAVVYRGQGYVGNQSSPNRGGDVLAIFGGNSGAGQIQYDFTGSEGFDLGTQFPNKNSVNGIERGDRLLGFSTLGGSSPCYIAQVNPATGIGGGIFDPYGAGVARDAGTKKAIPLGGPYHFPNGFTSLPDIVSARVINLGQSPNLFMLGVNAQNQLVQLDVLNAAGIVPNVPLVIAENVVDFRAVLGVKSPRTNPITWLPDTNTTYSEAQLAAEPRRADDIFAVRVAVVIRSAEPHNDSDAPTSYTVFPEDPSLRKVVSLDAEAARYRYQVYDATIQIRNMPYVPPLKP
jgi:type IV pilus assembly protein PilW